MKPKAYSNRELTQHLREMAAEIHPEAGIDEDDGSPFSRGHALAHELWKRALGWWEENPDDPGKKRWNKPEAWAIQFIYERMEGKTPTALADDTTSLTAADKVSDLAKGRINSLATAVAGDSPASLPPPPRRKRPLE